MASHIDLGKKGELMARDYLKQKAYRLLHCNWTHRRREIDIVAVTGNCLVFVEVKTLSSDRYNWPEERVDWRKIRYLQSAATVYLETMVAALPAAIRFDIIAITFKPGGDYELLHMEDAF